LRIAVKEYSKGVGIRILVIRTAGPVAVTEWKVAYGVVAGKDSAAVGRSADALCRAALYNAGVYQEDKKEPLSQKRMPIAFACMKAGYHRYGFNAQYSVLGIKLQTGYG